jgi:predicted anti-sigma-YlaC factor YlaD
MRCEERQLQLSLRMDAESGGMEQTGLFTHLEGCAECRHFFDSLLRFRSTARQDREEILREAEETLPARLPLPVASGARRPQAAWWRPGLPAPAALAFAVLLLVAGIAIGAGLAARPGLAPQGAPKAETTKQPPGERTYVYVCSMPQIEVLGASIPATGE